MSMPPFKTGLKGQMALKSSAFNASSGKLCAQHMAIDHMSAHYKKLLNAKSAIDASVPKAYKSSQKVRDRHKREEIVKGMKPNGKRPGSAPTHGYKAMPQRTNDEPFNLYDELDGEDGRNYTEDEVNCINAMVNETMSTNRAAIHTSRTTGSSGSGDHRTSRGASGGLRKDTLNRKKASADILEKRNHKFTEPAGDFTPRRLKSKYNVQSKLSQSKHYRPAKKSGGPPPANSSMRAKMLTDGNFSDTDTMDETLMSRDFSARIHMSGTVPPLDISMDQDHIKWLQEQSARHESSRYKPLEQELSQSANLQNEIGRSPNHRTRPPRQSLSPAPAQSRMSRTSQPLNNSYQRPLSAVSHNSYTKTRIAQEEEELRYLDFITEVTNDILTRGIFTNRVLKSVFEHHIEKNKEELDEGRMRGMLDGLRSDLGIPREDALTGDDDVGMGSKRPEIRSRSKVTGFTGEPSQFKSKHLVQHDPELGSLSESLLRAEISMAPVKPAEQETILNDIAEMSEKATTSASPSSHASIQSRTSSVKAKDDALMSLLGLEDDLPTPRAAGQNSWIQDGQTATTPKQNGHGNAVDQDILDTLAHNLKGSSKLYDSGNMRQSVKNSDSSSLKSAKHSVASAHSVTPAHSVTSDIRSRPQSGSSSNGDVIAPVVRSRQLSGQTSKHDSDSNHPVFSRSSTLDEQDPTQALPHPAPRLPKNSSPVPTPRKRISTSSTIKQDSEEAEEENDVESHREFGRTTLFGKTQALGKTFGKTRVMPKPMSEDDGGYSDDFSDDYNGADDDADDF